jgi:hypothetical protein
MTSQRSIFDEWRARLTEYQRELDSPAGARSWLVYAYTKVLRFLLSYYGYKSDLLPSKPPGAGGKGIETWVAEPIGPGKPARTTEVIRRAVDSIHAANSPGAESGPLTGGLRPDDLVPIAAFSNWEELDFWLVELTRQGCRPEVEHAGGMSQVKVPFEHYQRAKATIEFGPLPESSGPEDLVVVERFTNSADLDVWLLTFTQQGFRPQVERHGVVSRIKVAYKHFPRARALLHQHRRRRNMSTRRANPHLLEYDEQGERAGRWLLSFLVAPVGCPLGAHAGQALADHFGGSAANGFFIGAAGGAVIAFGCAFWLLGRIGGRRLA